MTIVGVLVVLVTVNMALVIVNVAVAGAPDPPLVIVTGPVSFRSLPSTAEVTATVTVQLPLAGIVPPVSASELPDAAAVTVPPQLFVVLGVAVLTRLVG